MLYRRIGTTMEAHKKEYIDTRRRTNIRKPQSQAPGDHVHNGWPDQARLPAVK